jgi:hypothetical protein
MSFVLLCELGNYYKRFALSFALSLVLLCELGDYYKRFVLNFALNFALLQECCYNSSIKLYCCI